MKVQDRDLRLLRWINEVGFVESRHIAFFMAVSLRTAEIRVKKLIDAGFLARSRIFHGMAGACHLTRSGVQLCGSELPALRRINLGSYQHDLTVLDLSLELLKYRGGHYSYERVLRHEVGKHSIGDRGHLPDGVLSDANGKSIAIEVELSQKGRHRLESIFNHHSLSIPFDYDELWYFCGQAHVERLLQPIVKSKGLDAYVFFRDLDYFDKGAC